MNALEGSRISRLIWFTFFSVFAVCVLVPLVFMVGTSLKPEKDIYEYPVRLIPKAFTFQHYVTLFTRPNIPMLRWIYNSVFVTVCTTFGVLLISSLAAYGFSRLRIPYKEPIFVLVIASMMIPFPTTLVPVYMFLQKIHWLDTYQALIIPAFAGPLGLFLLKQFFDTLPRELEEAAIIDGCSKFDVYWRVVLPLSKSVLSTLGTFVFLGSWNSFLWPLIVTNSIKMHPLPVGLMLFNGQYWSERGLIMAAATVCAIPVLIVFLMFQQYIVKGITMSGLKS